jgi:hypothetical protein
MGLRQLEWHEGKNGAWVARAVYNNKKYRRVADVNATSWSTWPVKNPGKVPVEFSLMAHVEKVTWHDSIEAAKLYVEAIFALDN